MSAIAMRRPGRSLIVHVAADVPLAAFAPPPLSLAGSIDRPTNRPPSVRPSVSVAFRSRGSTVEPYSWNPATLSDSGARFEAEDSASGLVRPDTYGDDSPPMTRGDVMTAGRAQRLVAVYRRAMNLLLSDVLCLRYIPRILFRLADACYGSFTELALIAALELHRVFQVPTSSDHAHLRDYLSV